MNLIDQIFAIREAGLVKRGHNVRFHGEYNIAEHSWQALALLYRLHPEPSQNLIWALAFHDCGERYFGDQPASVGWMDEELRAAQKRAEERALKALNLEFELSRSEELWVRAIDRLELLMWCLDQAKFGNEHVVHVERVVREWFRDSWNEIPRQVQDFFSELSWRRTSEFVS